MLIDVPRRNEKGEVVFTATLTEEQVQAILQFGLNFLMTAGLAVNYGIVDPDSITPTELDD